MAGKIGSELQPLGEDISLRTNDQELRKALSAIYSRGGFATEAAEYTATASIDPRQSRIFVNPAAFTTLTLPYANYWGDDRSPWLTIVNTSISRNAYIAASGSDTINGATSYSLRVGERIDLISDGVSKWYLVESRVVPRHNLIIGGNFSTNPWQRGTTITSPATAQYLADRFHWVAVGTMVVTAIKTSDSPGSPYSSPAGGECLHIDVTTADATMAAGDVAWVGYKVEGYDWAQIALEPFTFSFWHKHTKTGTYCVSFRNSGQDKSFVVEYTQTTADNWEYSEMVVAASPSAGTWNYTDGTGLYITFTLAAGTTWQTSANVWSGGNYVATVNQVNAMDSVNNNCKFNLIQLEPGTKASPFKLRTYGEELTLCHRYYYRATPVTAGDAIGVGYAVAATQAYISTKFPVRMRTAPTALEQSGTATDYGIMYAAAQTLSNAVPIFTARTSAEEGVTAFNLAAGLTVGDGCTGYFGATTGYLGWSAEL